MSSEPRTWVIRIRHILEAIEESRRFVEGMSYEDFCNDPRTLKAVVWNIATIGEASGQIPDSVRSACPGVPWQDMRGMRNHIVHGYDRIQGGAADIIKRAMIRIPRALSAANLSARMLLQVHDELVFEVPESEVEETKVAVVEVMENAAHLSVPLVVNTGVAGTWDEAH